MSYSLVDLVLKSSVTDPTEASVLVALASFADKYCSCYPSTKALCERSRYKDRAVQGAVKRLSERGILTFKVGRGRGGANFYTIHPSALKPAADAAISDDKTRSKCGNTDEENPHLTTLKPASDDIKPAADADEYVKEPVKNPVVRARGGSSDRILSLRQGLIEAMGMTGAELNTSASFPVRGMSPADLEMSLDVWGKDGLTDAQIIAAVRAKVSSERERNPQFQARSVRFFDGAIDDHAKRLKGKTTTSNSNDDRAAKLNRWKRIANS